jgi:pimeloyl-ACP methyl ester carboxylesterase
MLQHVSDNLGVVEALAGRAAPAIIIGHDWGAPIACCSALLRPDIFTAVAMLSVPYSPGRSAAHRSLRRAGQIYPERTW